jgi:hypothetical protein
MQRMQLEYHHTQGTPQNRNCFRSSTCAPDRPINIDVFCYCATRSITVRVLLYLGLLGGGGKPAWQSTSIQRTSTCPGAVPQHTAYLDEAPPTNNPKLPNTNHATAANDMDSPLTLLLDARQCHPAECGSTGCLLTPAQAQGQQ